MSADKLGKVLFRISDTLVARILTPWHRDSVVSLLARAFVTEPTTQAKASESEALRVDFADWTRFADFWGDVVSSNGYGHGQTNGAFISKTHQTFDLQVFLSS
jgi:hypothetical protein